MKIGIVGAGNIVPDFLEASKNIEDFEIVSISATENGRERMKKLSEEYGIKNIYTNYEDLLNDDIDVVYIAIPNSLHYEFAKKAIERNKHIILEKPFTTTYREAEELVELAQEYGIMLFEAISNQYLPNYKKTKELISELGDIKIVQLNYSQYSSRYDRFKNGDIAPAFDPKKSGGALMDLNVYNIYYIVGLFGSPQKILYTANIERNIDTSGVLVLDYGSFKCVAVGAKDCKAPLSMNIQGDKGYINSSDAANMYNKFTFVKNDGTEKVFELNSGKERLYHELVKFAEYYKNEDFDKFYEANEKSLIVMKILEEARKQAGLEF